MLETWRESINGWKSTVFGLGTDDFTIASWL